MDIEVIQEYIPLYVEAAKLTLRLAIIGILGAIIVGLLCSIIRYYKIPIIHKIVGGYVELSRNTPLLIQLFFLYFGLPKIGICNEFRSMCNCRINFPWRQLYVRGIP